jgi:tyrosyl-tRNA synthetase
MGSIGRASRIRDEVLFFKNLFQDCDIVATDAIETDLMRRLSEKQRLTIKFGIDPTATQLHLGWVVPLRRLRALQDRGHRVVLVVGDTTAQIGDPTGKSATRKMLTKDDVRVNIDSLLPDFGKILDVSRTDVVRNSDWWESMSATDLLSICSGVTVSQILERNDFANRLQNHSSVGLHEILYPIFQAQDSVQIKCDIELGGSDQRFNCLLGRDLMSRAKIDPQIVVLTPMFGKPGTWLGKYHSEKTKQKISKINSGKIHTEKSRKI